MVWPLSRVEPDSFLGTRCVSRIGKVVDGNVWSKKQSSFCYFFVAFHFILICFCSHFIISFSLFNLWIFNFTNIYHIYEHFFKLLSILPVCDCFSRTFFSNSTTFYEFVTIFFKFTSIFGIRDYILKIRNILTFTNTMNIFWIRWHFFNL